MSSLKEQIALVTGSSSGIGAAIARAFADAGAKVVINYASSREDAEKVKANIKAKGGQASVVKGDVSKEEDVLALFDAVLKEYGTLDILVNNAGVQEDAGLVDMTRKQWESVLGINLTGAFLCAREAAREFLRRGVVPERSKAAGKILFISSVHEVIPWAGHANYAAAKGGIQLLMKTIAQELAGHKVRVNSIGPGAIKTNINRGASGSPGGSVVAPTDSL